jgi:xylulokinase
MYLGIDLGTSEVKLLLLNQAFELVGTAGETLTVSNPKPFYSEQDPSQWWHATLRAVQTLRATHLQAWAQVKAIGLSGQMHGAVALDNSLTPLRPAILWNDGRCAAECDELLRRVPDLHERTGNLAMPGFTAPKLLWMQTHESALFSRVHKVLLPKDYLRLLLTGELASDPSDASGTLWLNPATRDWDDTLLAATGLNRGHMPRLVDGNAPSGQLRTELARQWGLGTGVVVAGGAGDNAASAVGIGAVAPGQGFISLGTSGVMFVVTDAFRPNPGEAVHAFCHTLPARWHQMTVMLSAASSVAWLTRLLRFENESALLAPLDAGYSASPNAPLFLPYLNGERTPHNNANARGVFFGMDATHGPADLAYAVLEGVAFGMAQGLAALRAAGSDVQRFSLVGGGARSAYWAQLHADVLSVEVQSLVGGIAGGALGAARLGAMAYGELEASVCTVPPVERAFTPHASQRDFLQSRFDRFNALYPRVVDLF